jgi:hypothetical protein
MTELIAASFCGRFVYGSALCPVGRSVVGVWLLEGIHGALVM